MAFFKKHDSKNSATPQTDKINSDDGLSLSDFMPKSETKSTDDQLDDRLKKIADAVGTNTINTPRSLVDARTKAEMLADEAGKQFRKNKPVEEIGGPKGLEPTRYGDWERAGRCSDF